MSINKKQVEEVLEKIRPALRMDGGDVELIKVDEKSGKVEVKLQGTCSHCPMATVTLKEGIEKELKDKIRGIKEVKAI